MDGGSFWRYNKKRKFIKSYKEQEILENHDHQPPEATANVDDDDCL